MHSLKLWLIVGEIVNLGFLMSREAADVVRRWRGSGSFGVDLVSLSMATAIGVVLWPFMLSKAFRRR